MANDFFTAAGVPATGTQGLSSIVRAEFASIASGFDKMPAMTGFPLKAVVVNGAGTTLTLTAGSLALAGNFTTTGAFHTTLVVGATVSITLPIVTGLTLATLTGTETFTNKTLTAPAISAPAFSGTATGSLTNLALSTPTLTTPAISNPVFSGASTGTLTLVGATLPTPSISNPEFSGTSTGTLTLVGATLPTPTLTTPSISNPAFSGTSTGTLSLVGATLPTPTLTTPSISNPAFSGTSTGTLSLVGATLPSPVLSGTATGTYTLAGTPTITAPAISSPAFSGTSTGAFTFSGGQRGAVTALTSTAASIAIDLATNNNFSHATTENTTLAAPSNPVAGQSGVIVITQGAAARTLAYNTFWKFPGGIIPLLTATIGAVDSFAYYVESNSRATCQLLKGIA